MFGRVDSALQSSAAKPTSPLPSFNSFPSDAVSLHTREAFALANHPSGGRTAWSSIVVVHGKTLEARFWYDGKNINNATEDAAECAVKWLIASAAGEARICSEGAEQVLLGLEAAAWTGRDLGSPRGKRFDPHKSASLLGRLVQPCLLGFREIESHQAMVIRLDGCRPILL
ncbi:hypothetical protein L249_2744 [Ophiocordyceps polyrhachis-furcata BCC 54312]|uniref:Uncharacterized protein n=1 Tax=Ophiocordyceps polyrhachis-furcata BCC 54312 TaxID=1330021 RepID=A0A367LPJ0_9HYPO|nr:hypothetical protein L249_2744 [Ophiocordyceps polyrhachis-furcata BCC 54312]